VLAEVVNTGTWQGRASSIALSNSLDASADDLIWVANEFGFEGADQGRDEKLYMAKAATGRPDRVHRMDSRRAPETLKNS
jgi:hypothetical protein